MATADNHKEQFPVTYCFSWYTDDESVRRSRLQAIAEAGIRHIVLDNRFIEQVIVTPELLGSMTKELHGFGLDFMDAHAPWGTWKDPGMPLESQHDVVVCRQRMALQICRDAGVTSMAYHTGNTFNSIFGKNLTLDDYYAMLLRSLEELLPLAERCGVVMALENQWTPLNQSAYLLMAVEHFNSPWLGICYDAGHANLVEHGREFPGQTVVPDIWDDAGIPVVWEENMVEKLQPWIVNCHLHDNDGIDDHHWLVGKGTVEWKRIMAALAAAPRLQCVQSEVSMGNGGVSPLELRQAFAGLGTWLDA